MFALGRVTETGQYVLVRQVWEVPKQLFLAGTGG
jgi:hypothetical protein